MMVPAVKHSSGGADLSLDREAAERLVRLQELCDVVHTESPPNSGDRRSRTAANLLPSVGQVPTMH